MKAVVIVSLITLCAAYWPQDGFDSANTYTSVPLDNSTVSPLKAVTHGVSTLSLIYNLASSPDTVTVSSKGAAFVSVNIPNGVNSTFIRSYDLANHVYTWGQNIMATGYIPSNESSTVRPMLAYTALHEASNTLLVPVSMNQTMYFLGLDYTNGTVLWHDHWDCNMQSAPRVLDTGLFVLMCDQFVHIITPPKAVNLSSPNYNVPQNVTTVQLPAIASPYQLLSFNNASVFAVSFDAASCLVNFDEVTTDAVFLGRKTAVLPSPCVIPSSCLTGGRDNFACGAYHMDLTLNATLDTGLTQVAALTPAGNWVGYIHVPLDATHNRTTTSIVITKPNTLQVESVIDLPELNLNVNLSLHSISITVEWSNKLVLVSAAVDYPAETELPRYLYVYAIDMTSNVSTIVFQTQANGEGMPSWGSVSSGPLVPTSTGSMLMISHDTESLFEFTCCSGNAVECRENRTCSCNPDYYLADCSVYCKTGVNGTCANGGVCAADTGLCACPTGYYGETCEIFCLANETCSSNGVCSSDGFCECAPNFISDRNLEKQCTVFCNSNTTCGSHGRCEILSNVSLSVGCTCDSDYFGANCSNYCNVEKTCHSHGVCNPSLNISEAGQCVCATGYFKTDCSVYCVANDTCAGSGHCDDSGSCVCDDSSSFGLVRSDCSRLWGLSDAAFIGIIVAIAAVVLALIILLVCCCRKRDEGYTAIRNEGRHNTANN